MSDYKLSLKEALDHALGANRTRRVKRTPLGIREATAELCRVALMAYREGLNDQLHGPSLEWVTKEVLKGVLLWKFSEAFSTHKLTGCPFWSVGAIDSLRRHGDLMTPTKLKRLELREDDALVHEHVYGRSELAELLLREALAGANARWDVT